MPWPSLGDWQHRQRRLALRMCSVSQNSATLLIENISGLNRWTAWLRVRKEALLLGLEPLVAALERGAILSRDTLKTFDSAYARWWVEQALDESPVLRTFNLAEHNDRLHRFRALDDEFTD